MNVAGVRGGTAERRRGTLRGACLVALSLGASSAAAQVAWQPSRPIEMTVAYARGGGTDRMARAIAGIVEKYGFSPQPIVVSNAPGSGGGEAMLGFRAARGEPHKLLAISAAIHMTPLSMPFPVTWRDLTPVATVAREHFLLWTYESAPYRSASDLLAAARGATPPRIGGAGAWREDHLIALSLAREGGGRFTYVAHAGGRPASLQLAERHVEATTGNPSDEIESWRAGTVRPLCVLSPARIAYAKPVVGNTAWSDVPTCAEQGVSFTYSMQRAIFLPAQIDEAARRFYVELLARVVATAEWTALIEEAALLREFRAGADFVQALEREEASHRELMREAGLLRK